MKRKSIVLCLIQCGETAWDVDRRIQGSADLPLSEAGREHVRAELHRVRGTSAAVVYHPPDEAASVTARLCAEVIGAKVKAVDELAEPHLGLLEGLTERDFSDRFPSRFRQWEDDPVTLSPPEGEEIIDAADRLFHAVARILKRSRSDEVAIVLHAMNLGLLRCWLAGRPFQDVRSMLIERPRVERYALPLELINPLEAAARDQVGQPAGP